jgi:hypothetical protein
LGKERGAAVKKKKANGEEGTKIFWWGRDAKLSGSWGLVAWIS